MGIRAHNNNHAKTVPKLFKDLIQQHGLPSHHHGDYGGENILVAEYMENAREMDRGSFYYRYINCLIKIQRLRII